MTTALDAAFEHALAAARRSHAAGDFRGALEHLERAHILGQRRLGRHMRVHLRMLDAALAMSDRREAAAQVWRLVLTPLGHLTGRLPEGNPGTGRVSAFASMPVPAELSALLGKDGDAASRRSDRTVS